MMKTIKVAVTGLGEFGELHLDILADMPDVEVVALVSRSEKRTRQLAERYQVPHTFQDTLDMLEKVALDAIHVVTSDNRHLAPTVAALRAGVDVFVEKPISFDRQEARQMVDEAAHLNRKLMVGHILRFDTKCAAIKERISRGDLGQLLTVYCRRNTCRAFIKSSRPHLFHRSAIHDIDIILWYFEGRKPVEVYMKSVDAFGEGDDVFWGMITFDDGSLGIVETAWVLPDATPWRGHVQLEAVGRCGTALIDSPGNSLEIWTDRQVERPNTGYWTSMHGTTVGALRDEIAYFLRCLREDRPITMPYPEDAINSLIVADALKLSSNEGHPIRL